MGDQFYVITGGPGSGKSSLIKALSEKGFRCMPEAGRAIIQDQVEVGGSALPWDDRKAFAALMLGWELRSHREGAGAAGPVFFDRAIPDVLGYLRLCGLPVPAHVLKAARSRRYSNPVFIAPPWPEIFVQDAERKQTRAEAEATFHVMMETYRSLDYELVPLPLASVEDRVRFVQSHVSS